MGKEDTMNFKPQIPDPQKARDYFQAKMSFTTGPVELKRWIDEGEKVQVIDVRQAGDYDEGHIPGAISLPNDRWDAATGLSKEKINVLYCYSQVCHLAAAAALQLAAKGFPVMELEGGFAGWQEHRLPVESRTAAAR
jgi:rhodanese-related sulfurtransferase